MWTLCGVYLIFQTWKKRIPIGLCKRIKWNKDKVEMIRNQKVALKPVSVVGASFCEVERMLVQVNNGLQSSILMQILVTSNLGIVQIQILEYEHNITMLSYYPGWQALKGASSNPASANVINIKSKTCHISFLKSGIKIAFDKLLHGVGWSMCEWT